ncbi:MAG: dihydroorotate dehydrogenase electron transfer subunit [Exiguobacterium oxidotolerans]
MIELLTVVSTKKVAVNATELICRMPEVKKIEPGRFMHLRVGPLLRRPISIANAEGDLITFLFKEIGQGTKELASLRPGDLVDALGPLGNGFPVNLIERTSRVVLVGGGIGVPPLYYTMRKLVERGVTCEAILGFDTADSVFYEEAFKKLGPTTITTVDGTAGVQGFVTAALTPERFDTLLACGPEPMLRSLQTVPIQDRFLSIENRMGCGIGACFACVCKTPDGNYVKTCSDGPVFRAEEVIL